MMKITITCSILMLLTMSSIAQNKPGLSDSLVKNKQTVLAKYIPMAKGEYLHKAYQIPLDSFVNRINAFKADFDKQFAKEKNPALKALKQKDVQYYSYGVLSHYQIYYGSDSAGMATLYRILEQKRNAPNFYKLIDSAQKLAFPVRLTKTERSRIDSLTKQNGAINDAALFKTSAAYRGWLNSYLKSVQTKKFPADTALGYGGDNVAMLKVVTLEIKDPFIREHLLYSYTATVLKSVKNAVAKENAYKDFMAAVKNPVYKSDIAEVYTNYKNMSANAVAPDFVYNDVDGKPVSLKSLRGKYVYIDVWATWCGPCKAEIPSLTKIEHDYSTKNIHFVSLSVDQMKDKPKWVSYVKENKLEGIQVMADKDFNSEFIKRFNINSIPRFILIDPNGKIVSGDAKRPSDPELRKEFDKLLN
ncbi:Thiol-disulfide oxidoreductase ResA [compost metagenome]